MPAPTFLLGGIIDPKYVLLVAMLAAVTFAIAARTDTRRDFGLTAVLLLNSMLFFHSSNQHWWEWVWMGAVLIAGLFLIQESLRRARDCHGTPEKFLHIAITAWMCMAESGYTATFTKVLTSFTGSFPLWCQVLYQITWMCFSFFLLTSIVFIGHYLSARKPEER